MALRSCCTRYLEVKRGEIVALIGANGAGKSTLLNTVMALVRASRGSIRFDGAEIAGLTTQAIVRRGLSQVPERRQLFGSEDALLDDEVEDPVDDEEVFGEALAELVEFLAGDLTGGVVGFFFAAG